MIKKLEEDEIDLDTKGVGREGQPHINLTSKEIDRLLPKSLQQFLS